MDLSRLPKQAKEQQKAHRKSFERLKKDKKFDVLVHDLHDQAFEKMDCLDCGNCCRTTSPIFIDKDIDRIAKHLRMKQSQFIEQYLKMDDEGDYVFNQPAPCPFLGEDNHCFIYEHRPRACADYPHTQRKRMAGLQQLTLKNAEICPAVFHMLEQMRAKVGLE